MTEDERKRNWANLIRRMIRILEGCPDHPSTGACGSQLATAVLIIQEARVALTEVELEPWDCVARGHVEYGDAFKGRCKHCGDLMETRP